MKMKLVIFLLSVIGYSAVQGSVAVDKNVAEYVILKLRREAFDEETAQARTGLNELYEKSLRGERREEYLRAFFDYESLVKKIKFLLLNWKMKSSLLKKRFWWIRSKDY